MSARPLSFDAEAQVRAVAHTLWVEEGMPEGRADDHWQKAVEIVTAQAAEVTAAAAPKRKAAAPAAAAPKKSAAAAKKAAPRKRG